MARSRRWCFTINNPTEDDRGKLGMLADDTELRKYLVYQLEEGKEGTEHIQGYVEFQGNRSKGLKWMKKNICERAHFETAKGSARQNKKYCTKEEGRLEGPFEFGEMPTKGERTDIKNLIAKAQEGASFMDLVEEDPVGMARYFKFIDRLKEEVILKGTQERWKRKRAAADEKTKVYVWWGDAGAGKTKHVYEEEDPEDIYVFEHMTGSSRWFDGYKGQSVLLMDEFSGYVTKTGLLQLTDPYPKKPLSVQNKGGFTSVYFEKIYILSNKPWDQWYEWSWSEAEAFKRRITEIKEFTIFDEIARELEEEGYLSDTEPITFHDDVGTDASLF